MLSGPRCSPVPACQRCHVMSSTETISGGGTLDKLHAEVASAAAGNMNLTNCLHSSTHAHPMQDTKQTTSEQERPQCDSTTPQYLQHKALAPYRHTAHDTTEHLQALSDTYTTLHKRLQSKCTYARLITSQSQHLSEHTLSGPLPTANYKEAAQKYRSHCCWAEGTLVHTLDICLPTLAQQSPECSASHGTR